MNPPKLTRRQREEKVSELLLLHEALPEWTVEELVRFAIANEEIAPRLDPPKFEHFDYSEVEYHADRQNRRTSERRLGSLPWLCAIGLGATAATTAFLIEDLSSYAFLFGVAGLIVGGSLGSIWKSFVWKKFSQTKYGRLASFERELFAYVYWSKRRAAQFWKSLSGLAFEKELAKVFCIAGYEATVTHASGDKGVDIILKKNGTTGIVQCKAHKGPVGPNIVRELLGSAIHFESDFAMLASTSGFTPAAIAFANEKSIVLLEVPDILRMQELGSSNSQTVEASQVSSTVERILYFPRKTSFGEIYVRDNGAGGELTLLAQAQGRVTLPSQAVVHVRVIPQSSEAELLPDLSPLSRFQPNDIQELDLFSVFLEDDLLKSIVHCKGLEWLRLHGMSLTDKAFQYLGQLTSLRVLVIEFGQFSGSGLKHLHAVSNLEELQLNGIIDFSDNGFEELSKLQSIRKLSLQLTDLTSRGLSKLVALPMLESLSFGPFVDFTDDILHELTRFRTLKSLEIGDPDPETLELVMCALPNCEILSDRDLIKPGAPDGKHTREALEDELATVRSDLGNVNSELLKVYNPTTCLTPELVGKIESLAENDLFWGLAQNRVDAGINGTLAEGLIDVVHEFVLEYEPRITKREVRDAISGYCYGDSD